MSEPIRITEMAQHSADIASLENYSTRSLEHAVSIKDGGNKGCRIKDLHLLSDRKHLAMISFRVIQNLSQEKAGALCDPPLSLTTWMQLENLAMIPTEEQAAAIGKLLKKNPDVLFPLQRKWSQKLLPLKTFSKLALLRVVRGITQEVLAQSAGVPIKLIYELEHCRSIRERDAEGVVRIAKFLDVLVADIMGQVSPANIDKVYEFLA